jgi:uncharacterized protein (TIGR00251 family)
MEIREHANGVSLVVRVAPRSSRDSIDGEFQGALKIRLAAPPIDDRANDALRKFLAATLNVPASAVKIVAGEKSRTKRVLIEGITREQARKLTGAANA